MSMCWEAEHEKRAAAYRELLGAKTLQGLSDEVILLNRAAKEARVGVNWRREALADEVILRARLGRVDLLATGPEKGKIRPGPSAEAWELVIPVDGPFCSRGCQHVYEHERACGGSDEPAVDPSGYAALSNEALLEVYDGLHADYSRYGLPGEHGPTRLEAARRLGLVKAELMKRFISDVLG